ncbi:aminoglycoside phosphotransferase family protein [Streptomyces sp. NPDC091292]|uniref:aminoglycoside phosphotransferase family protein n=1 Tax=Streptomyces sp. NPDC091292 TaxID=3365991 RepID=UPI00381C77C6
MDDFEIDDSLVRSLVREQHPDLAGLDVREVSGGWDNQLWRLGEELAVRMPRTARAPALLRKEHQWLPTLAPRLPLPVPTPLRMGEPSARFPRPWTIARWVPGEPADRAPISDEGAADILAGFLKALHVKAPAEAPDSPDRGVPLKRLTDGVEKTLEEVASEGVSADVLQQVRDVWDEAVAAPEWEGPPVWLHGDFHPANVVVSDGTLSGVIDFGDICAGDPAVDVSAAWVLLPAGAAARFFDAYAQADEAMIRRARGLAAMKCIFLIRMGRAGERGLPGGKPWGPAGRAGLDRVLAAIQEPGDSG